MLRSAIITSLIVGTKAFAGYIEPINAFRIVVEQPNLVEACVDERWYVNTDYLHFTKQGVVAQDDDSIIPLSSLYKDPDGFFILCKGRSKETQDHYDKAQDALIDAFGHSANAAISIEIMPPLAAYEVYKGTQSWIEAAKEYNAAKESERNDANNKDNKDK